MRFRRSRPENFIGNLIRFESHARANAQMLGVSEGLTPKLLSKFLVFPATPCLRCDFRPKHFTCKELRRSHSVTRSPLRQIAPAVCSRGVGVGEMTCTGILKREKRFGPLIGVGIDMHAQRIEA